MYRETDISPKGTNTWPCKCCCPGTPLHPVNIGSAGSNMQSPKCFGTFLLV